MLRVDFRALRQGPVETRAEIAPTDPLVQGLAVDLVGPLRVDGRLQETAEGEYYWRGRLTGAVRGSCRRCLVDVEEDIDAEVNALFSANPEAADDPNVYPIPAQAAGIDLTEAVREELALAAPTYWLCREECAGLCPHCGADLNAGACGCTATAEPG